MKLPPPATGVELYLAAVYEVLCDIRTALVDRSLARFVDERISDALGEVAQAVRYAPAADTTAEPASKPPTKRTRARTPR